MHCNRRFTADQNYWEVVVCSILRRRYGRLLRGLPTAARTPARGG
jgi:hypothetical protein